MCQFKEERERLGLTQQQFADIGGVTKTTLFNYENGRDPSSSFIASIATVGADVLYILTGVRLQTATEAKPANQREAALLDNYRNTPESLKRNAEETLSAFAQLKPSKKASGE